MKPYQLAPLTTLERHLKDHAVSLKPAKRRDGVESWFPYYAGYSSDFVREALIGLGAAPGWTVLDPWNGAGTTTSVADPLGCDALGFDINPVATLVAAARLAHSSDASHSQGLARELLAVATRSAARLEPTDPLLAWISPRLTRRYRSIERAVLALLGTKAEMPVNLQLETPPPLAAFFLLCLIRTSRGFARMKATTNPTWSSPERRGDATADTFDTAFLSMVESCAADAESAASTRFSTRATRSAVFLGDARNLPLDDQSIDAVITSPPYCTRIDYFRATLFELAALGIGPTSERFRELRSTAMGTNLMRGERPQGMEELPGTVRCLLRRIANHPSKASDTYYHRHYSQYFADAHRSLLELHRVLKPGACAVLVVQSSYYKNLPVRLGQLFQSLGKSIGFDARIVLRVPVSKVLANINSRATAHVPDRKYTEDVIALQRAA